MDINVIANIIEVVVKLLESLPDSFLLTFLSENVEAVETFKSSLAGINYFVPIGKMLDIMEIWLGGMISIYIFMLIKKYTE